MFSALSTAIRAGLRSEEHTSELQSRSDLVCRLLLEKKQLRDAPVVRAVAGLAAHRWVAAGGARGRAGVAPDLFVGDGVAGEVEREGGLFFFNDTAPPEIYALSLPDALPISRRGGFFFDRFPAELTPPLPGGDS